VGNDGDQLYTFAGISQYHRRFFDGLEQGKRPLAPLLRAAADLQQVSGELYRGNWTDIGTLERWQSLD
jgi:MurNAc alpha-1-phosphate uridylyltransferase